MKHILLAGLTFACIVVCSYPTVAADETNYQFWIDLDNHWYINKKTEFFGDYGFRVLTDDFSAMRFYGRPSIRYHYNRKIEVTGGVGVFYTQYDDLSNRWEFRPFEGIKIRWPNFDLLSLVHYVRFEQRIYHFIDDRQWEFNLRLRYKLGTNIPLKRGVKENFFFIPLSGELFWDVGKEVYDVHSNELRIDAGIGRVFGNLWTAEFHCIFQRSRSSADESFKINDIIFRFQIKWLLSSRDYRSNE